MQIKKFVAETLQEAMSQMKQELGMDAIILHSRNIPAGGLSDLSGKQMTEVLAAVEDDGPVKDTATAVAPVVPKIERPRPVTAMSDLQAALRAEPPVVAESLRQPPPVTDVRPEDVESLKVELRDLRGTMAAMAEHLRYANMPALPDHLQLALTQLLEHDVNATLAKQIVQEAHTQLKGDEYLDLRTVLKMVLQRIQSRLLTINDPRRPVTAGRIVGLIGPTGVGKTTTLAKLASIDKLHSNCKVALISADTFRIAAAQQLHTFANIAEIPFEVVYSPEDMQTALERFKDADRIYIDTTGRSQKDAEHLKDIRAMLNAAQADEVHLVMSATTRQKDADSILEHFQTLMFNRLLFTKLDETSNLGLLLNVANATKKPVSYLTTGQNVPNDIEEARTDKLSRMILRRKFL